MPKVGKKHYPYTAAGYKAAAKARKTKKKTFKEGQAKFRQGRRTK